LEQMLRIWQERGLMGGSRLDDDALTVMFSRKMLGLIHELFAMRATADYNIDRNLNRFLLLLLNVRKAMSARAESAFAVRNR
jgi:hypothetical protein